MKGARREGRQAKRAVKTALGNGQAWSSPSPRGQWRTGKNGGNWLPNHLWCPNDPRGYGIDDDDDDDDDNDDSERWQSTLFQIFKKCFEKVISIKA